MQCPKCLFHMDNHIDQVSCVTFVEKVSRWNSASRNINSKSTQFFVGSLWNISRYQDIKIGNLDFFFSKNNFTHRQSMRCSKGSFLRILHCFNQEGYHAPTKYTLNQWLKWANLNVEQNLKEGDSMTKVREKRSMSKSGFFFNETCKIIRQFDDFGRFLTTFNNFGMFRPKIKNTQKKTVLKKWKFKNNKYFFL